jgi:DNA-binding XRE family transcriptional regulator
MPAFKERPLWWRTASTGIRRTEQVGRSGRQLRGGSFSILLATFVTFSLLRRSLLRVYPERVTSIPHVARIFMRTAPHHYLRTFRKRSALTQVDIACFLGARSGAKVSRLERLSRFPNLKTAFACQAILGVPADRLFPGIFTTVCGSVTERARVLRISIGGRSPALAGNGKKKHSTLSCFTGALTNSSARQRFVWIALRDHPTRHTASLFFMYHSFHHDNLILSLSPISRGLGMSS